LRQIRPEGWTVLAWAGGAYGLLTLSIYQETRALTPALPAVALLAGAALLGLPWSRLRQGLLALILALGLVQFAAVSYEPVQRLIPPGTFQLPFWGQTTSLAQGIYIQLPDEGRTDRGFWIEPDILERMESQRLALGRESLSLGLLVNLSQINDRAFSYLIVTRYPHVQVQSLIEAFDTSSPYARLFGYDYLAVKRINTGTNPSQDAVIEAIIEGPPRLFSEAFVLETTYTMPYGDTVYLYRQRYPPPDDVPREVVAALAQDLSGRTRPTDAILLAPAYLVGPFIPHYAGSAEVLLAPSDDGELDALTSGFRRIVLVKGAGATGQVEAWLNEHTFRATHEWAQSLQVVLYGLVSGSPARSPAVQVEASFDGRLELVGYALPARVWQAGDIVPLTLFWQRRAPIEEDYRVFVHLLDGSGLPRAQADSGPVGGSRPTSGWSEGEAIVDRHGLLLPDDLVPGEYALHVGMYVPEGGERLSVQRASGEMLGDSLGLGGLVVSSP
jgi:hypothetical protein